MDLRERIRALLAEQSLSVRAVAEKSGVRRQSISAFLAGANLHLDNLQKLLTALGVKLEFKPLVDASDRLLQKRFPVNRHKLAALCRKYGIKRLSLFGSILRADFSAKSDVDVLVEFHRPVSLFQLVTLEEDLSKLVPGGRRIDVVTEKSLSKYFRDEVLALREIIYEEAA
jgi:hypothetical protein